MKVVIRDPEVLKRIKPQQVATYLKAHGWVEQNKIEDIASVWIYQNNFGEEFDIELPLNPGFRDFARRMSEVLDTLETTETRSQLEIISDIKTAWADVIRLRINSPYVVNGTMPVESGIDCLQHIKDMILWAACFTLKPQPYFDGISTKAAEYIRQLRMGQTEQNNAYIFTIISPLVSTDNTEINDRLSLGLIEPFPRQAIKTLALALETLRITSEKAESEARLAPVTPVEQQGISGNLCAAILGLNNSSGNGGIKLKISWSPLVAIPADLPAQIVLPSHAMPRIEEIGEKFKANWQKELANS